MMEIAEPEPSLYMSDDLRDNDIVCSKDKKSLKHSGNILFRKHIAQMVPTYMHSEDRCAKMTIINDIFIFLRQRHGCRFVKFNDATKSFTEVSEATAREKIGHSLRFSIRKLQKHKSPQTTQSERASKRPSISGSACSGGEDQPLTSAILFQRQQEIFGSLQSANSVNLREEMRPELEKSQCACPQEPLTKVNASLDQEADFGLELDPITLGSTNDRFSWTEEDARFLLGHTALFD